jgi:hypothetical protein
MIPIPYGYTSTSGFNLSKYQYVEGADIIFDFGNPLTTGSVAGSGYASNVITDKSSVVLNLTSQNPGGTPTLGGANVGGTLDFLFTGNPYCVWNYGLTAAQTTIVFFKPDSFLTLSGMPAAGNNSGLNRQNALRMNTSLIGGQYNVSSSVFSSADVNPTVNFSANMDTNSYDGWTMAALSTNGTDLHQFWQNNATGSTNTTVITRSDSNNTDPKSFGKTPLVDAGISGQLIAIMQYPRQLSQREIKQTFQLFKQRLA